MHKARLTRPGFFYTISAIVGDIKSTHERKLKPLSPRTTPSPANAGLRRIREIKPPEIIHNIHRRHKIRIASKKGAIMK